MGFGRRAVRGVRTPGLVQPNQNLNTYIWQLNGFGSRWGIPAESCPLAVESVWTQARVGRTSRRFASSYYSVAVAIVLFLVMAQQAGDTPPSPDDALAAGEDREKENNFRLSPVRSSTEIYLLIICFFFGV